jgi:hypothetical protein
VTGVVRFSARNVSREEMNREFGAAGCAATGKKRTLPEPAKTARRGFLKASAETRCIATIPARNLPIGQKWLCKRPGRENYP